MITAIFVIPTILYGFFMNFIKNFCFLDLSAMFLSNTFIPIASIQYCFNDYNILPEMFAIFNLFPFLSLEYAF